MGPDSRDNRLVSADQQNSETLEPAGFGAAWEEIIDRFPLICKFPYLVCRSGMARGGKQKKALSRVIPGWGP
jgi:hypothetical protein